MYEIFINSSRCLSLKEQPLTLHDCFYVGLEVFSVAHGIKYLKILVVSYISEC